MQKNKSETQQQRLRLTVEEDPATGDLILPFTPDMLSQVGWDFGDTIVWEDNQNGSWTLTKKND